MDKLYQVFLSSTYEDLELTRISIISALQNLSCRVVGMEMFPSSHMEKWDYMKKMIEQSDYFLVVSAGRYGEIVKDGKSYSELEFEYAVSLNKPIIVMLHADISIIPPNKSESTLEGKNKLEFYRVLLQQRLLVKRWKSKKELLDGVYQSTSELIRTTHVPGWIRGEDISSLEFVSKLENEKLSLEAKLYKIRQAGLVDAVIEFYNDINEACA